MIDLIAIQNSIKLYGDVRKHFSASNFDGCVIEISSLPMAEWTVHQTGTGQEMTIKRTELHAAKKPFIALYNYKGLRYLFFTDGILIQREILSAGKFEFSDIVEFSLVDKEQVRKEFQLLKMKLQNTK